MTKPRPANLKHGGSTAYNHYRCRCEKCVEWRRKYDRDRVRERYDRSALLKDGCVAYLNAKGLRLYGSGPFRRNPRQLASLIAGYLNDDLRMFIRDYERRQKS